MSSLKQFWKKLISSRDRTDKVYPTDNFSRFITSSKWYAASENRVKRRVFMPARNGHTSIFYYEKVNNCRDVALKYVHPYRKNVSIYGFASNQAEDFLVAKLSLVKSEPPPNHYNVGKWPLSKDEQLLIAQEIADKSLLVLFDLKIEKID